MLPMRDINRSKRVLKMLFSAKLVNYAAVKWGSSFQAY